MRNLAYKWTIVLFFVFGCIFTCGSQVESAQVTSIIIKDTYPGDTPDGFPSPGEKVALGITLILDFIPEEAYIMSNSEFISIEESSTRFVTYHADTLINAHLEPILTVGEQCPSDTIIPLMLIYRKDTTYDTLSFSIHTTGVLDSCYLENKIQKPGRRIVIKVALRATKAHRAGYSKLVAYLFKSEGDIVDSIRLFDDGKHYDGNDGDGLYANTWWTLANAKDYVIDIALQDTLLQHVFVAQKITGFTTRHFALTQPYVIIADPYNDTPENKIVDEVKELLDSLDIAYNTWNIWYRGYPDSSEISLWSGKKVNLIWSSKLGGTLKHSTKGKGLLHYFQKMGGNIFLATSYLGNYISEYGTETDSVFFDEVLNARFVSRLSSSDSTQSAMLFSPFTNQMLDTFSLSLSHPDSNGFISFAEIIKPVPPAFSIVDLSGANGQSDTLHYSIGLKVEKENSKLIYLSFCIDEISPFSTRKEFFGECLKWIATETADTFSYQPAKEVEFEFAQLSNPYPNPFLNESTIPFTLLFPSDVNLLVCDLAGRTVKHLIRSSLNEGNYYAVWDGKNEKGNETAVGYYFIRLSILTTDRNTGEEVNFVVSRKVLKLRK